MIYFLLKSAILLSVLYGCFFVLLSRETFHKFNRGMLLVILVSSLLLPACQVRMDKSLFMPEWSYRPAEILSADSWENIPETYSQASKETEKVQHPSATQITKGDIPSSHATFLWHIIPYCIYLLGVAWHILSILRQILAFRHDVQHGIRTKDKYDNTIIIRGGNFAPYSFFRYIVISAKDYEDSRQAILTHEQAHIRRRDHWWKPLGFLLLTVYWFNPLMWVAYIFLCRDIEAACDEKVLKNKGADIKKNYSEALINCSAGRRLITACPLAFGETDVKSRIKNILSYKKPALWLIIIALIVSIILSVCFMTNPRGTRIDDITGFDGIFRNVEKLKSLGLDVPQATELAYRLRKAGLNIPDNILDENECAEAILAALEVK